MFGLAGLVKRKIFADVARYAVTGAVMYFVGRGYLPDVASESIINEVVQLVIAAAGLVTLIADQKTKERHVVQTAIVSSPILTVEEVEQVAAVTAPSVFAPSPGRGR